MESSTKLTTVRFRRLFAEAVSFPGASPPAGSKYIGCVERSGEVWHFWKGVRDPEEGEVTLYATESGMEFAKKMDKKKKKLHKGSNFKPYVNYSTEDP